MERAVEGGSIAAGASRTLLRQPLDPPVREHTGMGGAAVWPYDRGFATDPLSFGRTCPQDHTGHTKRASRHPPNPNRACSAQSTALRKVIPNPLAWVSG